MWWLDKVFCYLFHFLQPRVLPTGRVPTWTRFVRYNLRIGGREVVHTIYFMNLQLFKLLWKRFLGLSFPVA